VYRKGEFMNKDPKKLALRVFKRNNRYLVLLWRRIPGGDPLQTEIVFRSILSDQESLTLSSDHFSIDEATESTSRKRVEDATGMTNMNVSEDTMICLIREREAGIDPNGTYYVHVDYGGARESIRVVPAGTFPSHEQEDKKKNVHHYGWHDESKDWRKISAVRGPRGQYYMGVMLVDPKSGKPLDPKTMKPFGGEED